MPIINACDACPAGTHAALAGESECTACAAGKATAGLTGQSSCFTCGQGGYCEAATTSIALSPTGFTTFTKCPVGTISEATGATSDSTCVHCAPGKYNDVLGATSSADCRSCLPGKYTSNAGMSSCSLCETGKYQPNASSSFCAPCEPAGAHCPQGSRLPLFCEPGTHTVAGAATSRCILEVAHSDGDEECTVAEDACAPCAPGTYQPSEGQPACLECTQGHYCPTGSSSPVPCAEGSYSFGVGLSIQSQCLPCPPGTECPAGAVVPIACEPGTHAPDYRMAKCIQCSEGTFTGLYNATECVACVRGHYCPVGSSSPIPCEGGTFDSSLFTRKQTCSNGGPNDGARVCVDDVNGDASYYGIHEQAQCQTCPFGSFCRPGSAAPVECSPGSYTPANGFDNCTLCEAGKYQPAANATVCITCPPGRYCPVGSIDPVVCAAGSHSSITGLVRQSQCSACPRGSECPAGATSPTPCAAGSYAADYRMQACVACEAGKYQSSASGETACLACTAGHYCPVGSSSPIPCDGGTFDNSQFSVTQTCSNEGPDDGPRTCVDDVNGVTSYYGIHEQAQCQSCPKGSFCRPGSPAPVACTAGSYSPVNTYPTCSFCDPGKYQTDAGATTCIQCPPGSACPRGSAQHLPCAPGTFSGSSGLTSLEQCQACSIGYECPRVPSAFERGNANRS